MKFNVDFYLHCEQEFISIHIPFQKKIKETPHLEELFGWASIQGTIRNLCLLGQVLCTFYGGDHPLHSEEGCQVGCIRGDDDEGEKPPNSAHDSTWERPGENEDGKDR